MKKNDYNKKKYTNLAILGLFIALIAVFVYNKEENSGTLTEDLNEQYLYYEHRSERGFGNDRFDVFSFDNIVDEKKDDLKAKDDDLPVHLEYMLSGLEYEAMENEEKANLVREINDLASKDDLIYQYIEENGTWRLILFSPSAEKGYYIVLTI